MTFTAGQKVRASQLNALLLEPAEYVASSAGITSLLTGGTSYAAIIETTGSVKIGAAFVAPASGVVRIDWGLNIRANTASTTISVATSVSTGATVGSGTSFSAASDNEAINVAGTSLVIPTSRFRLVTGLTAGDTYNAWIVWKNNSSGTADANHPFIGVTPQQQ
ncbi:MAG TPA: hypothetical protein VFX16_21110 [Pseudonocardiaceae bacterium]|nr:hypothetical protein [Pseudonocardiaceae bacterium]